MEEKKQFDEFLGGTESLPHEVPIMKLAAARASEIAAMTYSIDNPQQTKLIFQKLPTHMRRRVMSHNAKRLPRRLREAHLKQMIKSGLPPKTKKPSRRYRRRPYNLLMEYNRRQRNKIWLETHIWHAKRFHMIERWGYRIANHANDKCFRANYRAVAKHCLMQDLSYYACIEINGPENFLKDTLKAHCNPTELTFNAKIYTNGHREGILMFFKRNGYPTSPIGNVYFFWNQSNQSNIKTIWIWVHPAFYNDFLTEITSSFEFKPYTSESVESTSQNHLQNYSYVNTTGCRMNLLKNTLNRFRLYGPLSLNVLTDALELPNISENLQREEPSSKMDCDDNVRSDHKVPDELSTQVESIFIDSKSWYVKYYNNQENIEAFKVQKQLWQMLKTMNSPHQLPRNMIFGCTVLDPRFSLPEKRTKSQKQMTIPEQMLIPPIHCNLSPIWDQRIREEVSRCCVSTSAINKLRSKNLVPGIGNDRNFTEDIMAKIPILFIQKPGNFRTGLGSSIDIIIPARWAMPFWLAFLFRCTKVGALRESKLIAFESNSTNSADINDPDTIAYKRESVELKEEWTEKYFRYPPNRRVNFVKLGISSPFNCEWNILMKEWSGVEDFYVLRDRNALTVLKKIVSSLDANRKHKENIYNLNIDLNDILKDKNCLVRVKISMLNKGCPKMFAIICTPTNEDLEKVRTHKQWSGPVEKLNHDPNENRRRILRRNHLALLKRYRRQRVRHKKSLENKIGNGIANIIQSIKENVEVKDSKKKLLELNRKAILEQFDRMSKLYLPDCKKVRYSCDREVMGYIILSNFSFSDAKGVGIGYVTMESLFEAIARKSNVVLVRNNQTRQYRVAQLEILYN